MSGGDDGEVSLVKSDKNIIMHVGWALSSVAAG